MKWTEMTPEERNRLVAEKVMGWQSVECDGERELTIYDDGDAWCPRCHARAHISSFAHTIIPPPAYTQSLDAAWRIADTFDEIVLSRHRPGKVRCELYKRAHTFQGVGKTPHEAICLAALIAHGVVIET